MSDSDIQRLEQRLAALEAKLGGGAGAQFESPGGGGQASAPGGATPAEWLAGAIAAAFPQGLPTAPAQQSGAAGAQMAADSVFWCNSRFFCATMHCGGSGWC